MKNVIKAFINGYYINSKCALKSLGGKLYSYDLVIAEWTEKGIVIYDYTKTGKFVSMTTSKHVGLIAREFPNRVVKPNA